MADSTLRCLVCNKKLIVLRKDRIPRYCSGRCSLLVNRKTPKNFWLKATLSEQLIRLKSYFDRHVIRKDGCWLWKGYLNDGYGVLSFKSTLIGAHRASWLIHKGSIPKDLIVLHNCDNRACTNPDHLRLGTHRDNSNDKYKRKRDKHPSCEDHCCAKINNEQAKLIKSLLENNMHPKNIFKLLNISINTIYNIKYKKAWKGLSWVI